MKKILIGLIGLILLFIPNCYAATLTAGCTPVVAVGGTAPQIQCASIYDTGNTNATGDVGIAEVVPQYTLDINGTLGNSNGDIDSNAWQAYSSSVLGWSGSPTISVYTKRLGKTVLINYYITGTSNANYAEVMVPYIESTGSSGWQLLSGWAVDNGGIAVAAVTYISNGVMYAYKDANQDAFTSSGTKTIRGQFWYQSK